LTDAETSDEDSLAFLLVLASTLLLHRALSVLPADAGKVYSASIPSSEKISASKKEREAIKNTRKRLKKTRNRKSMSNGLLNNKKSQKQASFGV
jgi:hypothetical protein